MGLRPIPLQEFVTLLKHVMVVLFQLMIISFFVYQNY
jgi:hypothetical protein